MREDGEQVLRDLVRNKIAANATGEREIGKFGDRPHERPILQGFAFLAVGRAGFTSSRYLGTPPVT